jgi:hypothetical protein
MTAKVIEVMRNTSGMAPDFPNVELNTADTMFLVLILYSTSPDKEKTDR